MRIERTLRAATFVALVAGWGGFPAAQGTNTDPCRFYTAEVMGKAFGRAMKSSKLVNVCEYRGPGADLVVLKVEAGSEGTILKHAKATAAKSGQGVEKVTTAVGEAYFDGSFPVFIGRVGNNEVQIETTIQPTPRDAMVAVGTRIMEALARK
jgi:hypothetical protein